MAHIAPASPGTAPEANWYVPVLGMGGGSMAGKGITALKAQWAETMRRLGLLPTTANVVEQAGGTNIGGEALPGVRGAWTTGKEIEALSEREGTARFENYRNYLNAGGRDIKANEFLPRPAARSVGGYPENVTLQGGMVPDRNVWDRVINTMGGMNDPQVQRMLGFGR